MTVIFRLDKHMIFRTYRSIAKSHELLCEITHFYWVPFGKHTKNYGNSTCLMCKSTISMAIFTSKLFVYQKVAHGNSPFLLVKSLLLMTGDVPRGDGSANARRLAFNVPSASVQNRSLEEARMLLGDVEVIFFLYLYHNIYPIVMGVMFTNLAFWGLHVGYPPQLWPFTTYNY